MRWDTCWRTCTRRKGPHGILAAALALLTACGSGQEQAASRESGSDSDVLHVYDWADYIGESTIKDFETRNGTKVTYDVFDSPEMLSTKLLTGRSGYDVVFPAAVPLRRDAPAGVFLTLDSWAAVFNPAVASKLADCGITMLDEGGDVLSAAKIYLGRDLNSEDAADMAAAKEVLMGVRRYIGYFDSSRSSGASTGSVTMQSRPRAWVRRSQA